MAYEPGGYADKLGNRYEGRWVVKQLLCVFNQLNQPVCSLVLLAKKMLKLQPVSVQNLKKGTPIEPHDLSIDGTAIAHQLTLITRNISEFERIEKLQIEDWF